MINRQDYMTSEKKQALKLIIASWQESNTGAPLDNRMMLTHYTRLYMVTPGCMDALTGMTISWLLEYMHGMCEKQVEVI